jgi:hypothetical protein
MLRNLLTRVLTTIVDNNLTRRKTAKSQFFTKSISISKALMPYKLILIYLISSTLCYATNEKQSSSPLSRIACINSIFTSTKGSGWESITLKLTNNCNQAISFQNSTISFQTTKPLNTQFWGTFSPLPYPDNTLNLTSQVQPDGNYLASLTLHFPSYPGSNTYLPIGSSILIQYGAAVDSHIEGTVNVYGNTGIESGSIELINSPAPSKNSTQNYALVHIMKNGKVVSDVQVPWNTAKIFSGFEPAKYTISAEAVTDNNGYNYLGTASPASIDVLAGKTTRSKIDYTLQQSLGEINISLQNIPNELADYDSSPVVLITDIQSGGSISKKLDWGTSTTISSLREGSTYQFSTTKISHNNYDCYPTFTPPALIAAASNIGTSRLNYKCIEVTDGDSSAPLVSLGQDNRLIYKQYANQGENILLNKVPDFSFAGYGGGGVSIPDVNTVVTLTPQMGDNLFQIQAAIDKVSQLSPYNGFRGAVLLKKGTYKVSNSLKIHTGGVVLRGEGQDSQGTVLIATTPQKYNLIEIMGKGEGFSEIPGTRVQIKSQFLPVGTNVLEVDPKHNFKVGDLVIIQKTPNQAWIDYIGTSNYGWTPGGFKIGHERIVTDIKGSTITINIPLVDSIDSQFGGGSVFKADLSGRIEKTGVENMRLVSEYASSEDESHGWNAILLARTSNSWVRRVTAQYFGMSAVEISAESNFNTVEETAMLDPVSQITGGRRYAFYVSGGLGNLFQRCYSRNGRHNFVTGSRVTGPNVWLDSVVVQSHADDGPHHRWATGALFDNISSDKLYVQNRRTSGSGHGWAGAQILFWNSSANSVICDSPPGAMNWTIGTQGKRRQGVWPPAEAPCWTESEQTHVLPRSLYLQQLQDRLGTKAVEAITIPAQMDGGIESLLQSWAGEGSLANTSTPTSVCSDGIPSGTICCAKSCGICGGSGCSGRPGGAEACCSGNIQKSGRICSISPAPCIIDQTNSFKLSSQTDFLLALLGRQFENHAIIFNRASR